MNWFGKLYFLKNDLVYELTQASHDYEKLREEHPRIGNIEDLIDLSLPIVSIFPGSYFAYHLMNAIPPFSPIPLSPYEGELTIEDIRTLGAFSIACCSSVFGGLFSLAFNPGEKILKSSYAVGKAVRNGFGTIKSYLKGMQELKRERKEVNLNER